MIRMRAKILTLFLGLGMISAQAQVFETENGEVKTGGFWDDWFVQMGLDMTLQNPYGYDFSKVFPNGKTFGLDLAAGKWFTHQVGVRGKFNWENKLPLLENEHANWLAPFDQPGVNREKGGYIAVYGDVLLNMHNFFGVYRPERKWNLSLYPRIGVNYNFGVSKGSLLAAVGVLNTYRLSDRWSLYGDIAYIMTGSGFVGKEKVKGTGTGSNSNGYLSIGVGESYKITMSIPNGTMCMVYKKTSEAMKYAQPIYDEVQAVTPGKINYGIQEYPKLNELYRINKMAVYTEVDFHDNPYIAKWIIEHPDVIGEALAKGVCKAYGMKYIAP